MQIDSYLIKYNIITCRYRIEYNKGTSALLHKNH